MVYLQFEVSMQGFCALRCSGLGLVIAYTLLRVYRRAKFKISSQVPTAKGDIVFFLRQGFRVWVS